MRGIAMHPPRHSSKTSLRSFYKIWSPIMGFIENLTITFRSSHWSNSEEPLVQTFSLFLYGGGRFCGWRFCCCIDCFVSCFSLQASCLILYFSYVCKNVIKRKRTKDLAGLDDLVIHIQAYKSITRKGV